MVVADSSLAVCSILLFVRVIGRQAEINTNRTLAPARVSLDQCRA